VENCVLFFGLMVVDIVVNVVFYYGLVKVLVEDDCLVWL